VRIVPGLILAKSDSQYIHRNPRVLFLSWFIWFKPLLHVLIAPADAVPEGTVTGDVSGVTARTHYSGDLSGVRSGLKRKSSNPNPERGGYNC